MACKEGTMKRGLVWLALTTVPFLAFGQMTGGLPALRSDLNNETVRATNRENVLQGNINAEVTRATAAEAVLDAKISHRPHLFFKNRPDCIKPQPGPPECRIPPYIHPPWVFFWPILMPYTTLVELTLPDGDFFVTAKLSAYPEGAGAVALIFECALYDARYEPNLNDPNDPFPFNPGVDLSSFDGGHQQTLYFQTPVSFHTGGGAMKVGCRSTGYVDQWGGNQTVDMFVWNVSIAASRVGTVIKE
jgi:hypothetical protein